MASIKEIVEIENARQQPNEIHLFAEGSFLRAYERSAWLCVRCINEFKVTKRQIKGIESPVCFVGFPQTSADKWLPDDLERLAVDDRHTIVTLPVDRLPSPDDKTMNEMFRIWKDNTELSEPSKSSAQRHDDSSEGRHESAGSSGRLTDIMREILSFPIERKSPMDCMKFIADIKLQLATII